ncbi:MAG: hypothetical protein FJZ63_02780, partial [Chlamydiae bacterium]|nr:hypothetical protein [Chlamydiota bacterium]
MRGYQSPFFGFRFFVSKPSLWWIPLMGMAIAYGLLMFVFVMVAYSLWPGSGESPLEYSGDALKALGLGALVALGVWVVVTPLLFTLCFEKMLKRMHLMKGDVIERISLLKSLQSSLYIFFKTLGWRLFWVV